MASDHRSRRYCSTSPFEVENSVEQREAVVDLETADRELGCAAEPREIDVVRQDRR